MTGWERKLGLVLPSWNTVMEYEFQRLAAGAMSMHSARIAHTADTEANLLWMGTQVPAAAALLAHAKVDVICYGCTAGGFLKGPQYDRAMSADIATATGIAATTSAAAVVDALRAVKARRVSVASPYEPWLNEKLKAYLAACGFEVLAMQGLATQAHGAVTPERVAGLAAEADRPHADALFISCSNLRTLEVIAPLEEALGKPVVTSNAASMWKCLRVLGDTRVLPGAGRLFLEA